MTFIGWASVFIFGFVFWTLSFLFFFCLHHLSGTPPTNKADGQAKQIWLLVP